MKVRMLTTSAGPDGVFMAGEIINVSSAKGRELIKGGYAQLVDEPKAPKETARLKGAKETTESDSAKADTKEKTEPDKNDGKKTK